MPEPVSTPEQRTAILRAAVDLLRREGPTGLRVRTVAAAAGCSTTGVYTWFGGKNGLVEAILLEGFERFDAALAQVRRRGGARGYFLARMRRYRTWALENPTHYLVMFGDSVPEFEASVETLLRTLRSFEDLVAFVAESIDGGLIAGDPADVAFHVWATIHGYVMLELTGHHPPSVGDPGAAYDRALELLLAGLRPG